MASALHCALGHSLDELALEDQEQDYRRSQHEHRRGVGQCPVAVEAAGERVQAGGDRYQARIVNERYRDQELVPSTTDTTAAFSSRANSSR